MCSSDLEAFYSSYRLELQGLLTSLAHWRYLLLGRKFTVLTDHRALEWIRKTQNPNLPAILVRLQASLGDYEFEIVYTRPSQLAVEDALSRLPFEHEGQIASWRVSGKDPWLLDDVFWIKALTKKESSVELNTYCSFTYQLPVNLEELNDSPHT